MVAGVNRLLYQAAAVFAPPHSVLVVELRRRATHDLKQLLSDRRNQQVKPIVAARGGGAEVSRI